MTKIATCWCLHKSNKITKKSNVGYSPLKKKNNKCELSEQAGNRKHASVQCTATFRQPENVLPSQVQKK
jgi:hypothetical protein